MALSRFARPFLAGLALAATILASPSADARTNYNGNWSVLIVTERGTCDRAYRYGVAIRDGAVIYEGSAPVNVAGRVYSNGTVNVRVWAGSQSANGTGRLGRNVGGGTWHGQSSSSTCSGSWTAERR